MKQFFIIIALALWVFYMIMVIFIVGHWIGGLIK